jgi:putative addiction module killer protein
LEEGAGVKKKGEATARDGNGSVTIVRVLEYVDPKGRRPFAAWFQTLDVVAADKVATAVYRLALGSFSNVKGVGAGVLERRIDYGPGYRIYFGRDGECIVILLGGGMKTRQAQDISTATRRWWDYRRRKPR